MNEDDLYQELACRAVGFGPSVIKMRSPDQSCLCCSVSYPGINDSLSLAVRGELMKEIDETRKKIDTTLLSNSPTSYAYLRFIKGFGVKDEELKTKLEEFFHLIPKLRIMFREALREEN